MPGFYENAGDPGNQFGTSAQASATEAKHWANYTEDLVVPEDGTEYSAKHYAAKAAASAASIATSEANAAASATAAASSESSANTSASAASASEANAATSETNAGTSETNAAASAAAASTSASSASTSASSATASASSASTSASSASTSASSASTSATSASTSATNASTSETNAAASAASAAASAATVPAYATVTGEALNFVRLNAGETSMEFRTPAEVQADLSLEPGVDVQAYDATLETGATKTSRKNAIINGNFDVWQRGTSFSSPTSGDYVADRWKYLFDGGGTTTLSRQSFTPGQTDVPSEPAYHLKINATVAKSGATTDQIQQHIENVRTFAGETVTLTFYAKAAAAETLPEVVVAQNFGTGGSPSSSVTTSVDTSIALTTVWQRFEYTFTLPSISGKTLGSNEDSSLVLVIRLPLNELFNIDIARVQLEKGSVATDFERRSTGEELALCQRYYYKVIGTDSLQTGLSGTYYNSTTAYNTLFHPVPMRTAPTASYSAASGFLVFSGSSARAGSAVVAAANGTAAEFNITTASASLGDGCFVRFNSASDYYEFDAEL